MNTTLLKALLVLVPVLMLFSGAAVVFVRRMSAPALLQLIGAGCLVIVIVAHVCEALSLFSFMHWGEENSTGHYIDLVSVVLGLTLFPIGYLWQALTTDTR